MPYDYSFSPQPPYRARSKAFFNNKLCAYLRSYIPHHRALTSPNPKATSSSRYANPSRIASCTRCEPVDTRG
ncbi:hypothetical protein P691DRAFT_40296 [Macrolepiota fuliginosa MF-IS2]|uniref:Uncharacterized protein n=1 Tax=Macrolepiota fuliginosa MF-IS2 TaxID=1400762 RepID=A0A9P6C1J7_9AGAR|nr:hypothetical protein P691DRAFT_40296 [Macrolepiota fuliginosa MF-IS2]